MAKLGIVLLILEILGWTVVAILALVLILLFMVLFIPVRWSVSGDYNESGRALANVSWLGAAVRGFASFETGSGLTYSLKIFRHYLLRHDGNPGTSSGPGEYRDVNEEYKDKNLSDQDFEEHYTAEQCDVKPDSETVTQHHSDISEPEEAVKDTDHSESSTGSESRSNEESDAEEDSGRSGSSGVLDRITGIMQRIAKFFVSIKNRIAGLIRKIKKLDKKRKRIAYFLTHETTEYAVKRLKQIILKFLGHLVPRKVQGSLTFGFEDPSITGKVLGLLCTRYPDWAGKLSMEPVFDHRTLKGNIDISGNIRLIYAAIAALQILCDKRIRVTFGRAKRILSGGH